MTFSVRSYTDADIKDMMRIWNEVVYEGVAFPQEDFLEIESARRFFASQDHCGVVLLCNKVCGMYILHPNNVGRCSHICNASYAVASDSRGMHAGEALVKDCLRVAALKGYRIMQFNAVVASNVHARHLYERLGFIQSGVIPAGFRMKDGHYEDICPYYLTLQS